MQTRIQKWGNSLALRIPKSFAVQSNIELDTVVDLSLQDGRLIISPVNPTCTLEQLLSQVTEENRHAEEEVGPAVGNEAWK